MPTMFRCYLPLFTTLLFVLPFVCQGQDFASLIYKEYGYAEYGYNESRNLYLSNGNLTRLSQKIVNGYTFNTPAALCNGSTCSNQSCYSPTEDNGMLSISEFSTACPRILYSLTQDCIKSNISTTKHEKEEIVASKPSALKVWGYGFLFVTLINLCSLAGIFVLPLMKKKFYSTLLMFLIALAVGSLAANGVLVLIPEAFEIVHVEGYIWRSCTIVGGIYLFFITERILKMITEHFVEKRNENTDEASSNVVASIPPQTFLSIDRTSAEPVSEEHKLDRLEQFHAGDGDTMCNGNGNGNGFAKHSDEPIKKDEPEKPIATVAWMIIFGDAFHNFIDGLSIGAAFSDSILLGVSICIAVLCEELPHELGDFAILLNAGMSKKKALLFNFLSACTCYLGLIIGITLSGVAHATPWILGVAGGMFLYIALADMMPEMNRAAEEHKDQPLKVFLIQNFGFLSGFGVILLVSHFGAQIQL